MLPTSACQMRALAAVMLATLLAACDSTPASPAGSRPTPPDGIPETTRPVDGKAGELTGLPEDARVLPSGVAFRIDRPGRGPVPAASDIIALHVTARDPNGNVIVDSRGEGPPKRLPFAETAPWLQLGMAGMHVHEVRTIWIPPSQLDENTRQVTSGQVFTEVEILSATSLTPPADLAGPPTGAVRTSSGLAYLVLRPGRDEAPPLESDRIRFTASTWSSDGSLVFTTATSDGPTEVPVSVARPAVKEMLLAMRPGEQRRFWAPGELVYRDDTHGPYGPLVTEVELWSVVGRPFPPPDDVSAPPAEAQRLPSGVATLPLTPGRGQRRAPASGRMLVSFSLWTADGSLIESTVMKGAPPMQLRLEDLPPGWREAMQLMVEGEKRRVWVPAALWSSDPSAPAPMDVTVDVELVELID